MQYFHAIKNTLMEQDITLMKSDMTLMQLAQIISNQ